MSEKVDCPSLKLRLTSGLEQALTRRTYNSNNKRLTGIASSSANSKAKDIITTRERRKLLTVTRSYHGKVLQERVSRFSQQLRLSLPSCATSDDNHNLSMAIVM